MPWQPHSFLLEAPENSKHHSILKAKQDKQEQESNRTITVSIFLALSSLPSLFLTFFFFNIFTLFLCCPSNGFPMIAINFCLHESWNQIVLIPHVKYMPVCICLYGRKLQCNEKPQMDSSVSWCFQPLGFHLLPPLCCSVIISCWVVL